MMTQDTLNKMVADMRKNGTSDDIIRRVLFNAKGVKTEQIIKAMNSK